MSNNTLVDKNFYNSDAETIKSNDGDNFYNDVSPSHFNIPNQRFSEFDETSQIPQKPQLNYQIEKEDADIIQDY